MMSADQVLHPASGGASMGLVQDALLGAYTMTARDAFFTRAEAMEMMMHGAMGSSTLVLQALPQPAILKPVPLWTGKQLVSLALPECLSKVRHGDDDDRANVRDTDVLIDRGRLLTGRLTKADVGASASSIFHTLSSMPELSGVARRSLITGLFDALERMCMEVHTMRGFSVGIGDMMLDCQREWRARTTCVEQRLELARACATCRVTLDARALINAGIDAVDRLAAEPLNDDNGDEAQERHAAVARDEAIMTRERAIIAVQDRARDDAGRCVSEAFARFSTGTNAIQAMATAGSKGSPLNLAQIAGCVGGQMIVGHRVADYCAVRHRPAPVRPTDDGAGVTHTGLSRSLAQPFYRPSSHFAREYPGALAGGFAPESFMMGQGPRAFFVSAQGGRQGLVDTACNTAESGYLQRRMVKGTEDLTVAYDGSVRNANSRIIQFSYGPATQLVRRKRVREASGGRWTNDVVRERLTWTGGGGGDADVHPVLEAEATAIVGAIARLRELSLRDPLTHGADGVSIATLGNIETLLDRQLEGMDALALRRAQPYLVGDVPSDDDLERMPWRALRPYETAGGRLPALEVAQRVRTLLDARLAHAIDEVHRAELRIRLASRTLVARFCVTPTLLDRICSIVESTYRQGWAEPGLPVGVIAAQSLGEPATQTTLNSFHYRYGICIVVAVVNVRVLSHTTLLVARPSRKLEALNVQKSCCRRAQAASAVAFASLPPTTTMIPSRRLRIALVRRILARCFSTHASSTSLLCRRETTRGRFNTWTRRRRRSVMINSKRVSSRKLPASLASVSRARSRACVLPTSL